MCEGFQDAGKLVTKPKELEELKILCQSEVNLELARPDFCCLAEESLTPLPRDRLPRTSTCTTGIKYTCPPSPELPAHYRPLPHMRESKLNVITTPDSIVADPAPILMEDMSRLIRVVHYDRGPVDKQWEIEAKEMCYCRNRFDSFNKSEHLKGKAIAYQLSQLGYFFVGDSNAVGKLRCSFCRRTIHMFNASDATIVQNDCDRRLIDLLHRHAHISATCPFTLGLNGDDERFSQDDINNNRGFLLKSKEIQLYDVKLCSTPHNDELLLVHVHVANDATDFNDFTYFSHKSKSYGISSLADDYELSLEFRPEQYSEISETQLITPTSSRSSSITSLTGSNSIVDRFFSK